MCRLVLLVIGTFSLFLSCGKQDEDYIVKTSPDGKYRVEVSVRALKATGTREYDEQVTLQFFKGGQSLYKSESRNSDQFEPSFGATTPSIEWIGDNIIRMGGSPAGQPFHDELIIVNDSDERLTYCDVSYGAFETFFVFDLPARSQTTLQGSPRFNAEGYFNWFLGYGGKSESGKEFHGSLRGRKRESPSEGPLRFEIKITGKDFR